jgi:hypothetical protein
MKHNGVIENGRLLKWDKLHKYEPWSTLEFHGVPLLSKWRSEIAVILQQEASIEEQEQTN